MVEFFLVLHLSTLSWQSVLRLSDWSPLPVLTLFAMTFSMVVTKFVKYKSNNNVSIRVETFDFLIVLALMLMYLNVFVAPTNKGGNYLLAYSLVFGSYLVCLWFSDKSINIHNLLRANFYGINFICCLMIIEVVGRLVFGVNFLEVIPRVHEATATVTLGLFRGYGLSSEPTQVGNYFCCFSPYAIYYAQKQNIKNFQGYIFFVSFAAVLTFSVTLFLVIFCSILIIFVMINSKRKFLKSLAYIGFLFSVSIFVFVNYFGFYEVIFGAYETIVGKLALNENSTSVSQRVLLIERGIADVANNPVLGKGLGSLSSKGLPSNINWYLFVASEAGLIILFLFVAWFSIQLISALMNYKTTSKGIYLVATVSIFSGMAYLIFISTFQNLFLLTSILLYRLILKSNSSQGKTVRSI